MLLTRHNRWLLALNLCLVVLAPTITVRPLHAVDFKRTAIKIAVCGGGAYGGYKLGDKIAEFEAKKLKLGAEEAAKHRKAIQLGMAAALCGAGYYLTGTVYANLSKRDRQSREREMEAALADSAPGTRNYVLPDSKLQGRLVTDPPEQVGDKQCRTQVDFLAKDDEPARTRWCRKSDTDKFELDI